MASLVTKKDAGYIEIWGGGGGGGRVFLHPNYLHALINFFYLGKVCRSIISDTL